MTRAIAEPPAFVLDLPNGGTLAGAFAPSGPVDAGARETLRWKAPAFIDPFDFRLAAITGIRAAKPRTMAADPNSFRCQLSSGDIVDGHLEGITADAVVLKPGGSRSSVRVDRAIVSSIRRRGRGEGSGYVGPGSLVGWRQEPEASWRDESARLSSNRRNASLTKDLAAPSRARYDIVLSWNKPPEFTIALAAGDSRAQEPYRFEMLANKAGERPGRLVRHEKVSNLEEVPQASLARGRLGMSMFVDGVAGRLAIAVDGSDEVVETTVPPGKSAPAAGVFRLTLFSGDICLESLRVTEWKTPDPKAGDLSETSVLTREGTRVIGTVSSLDGVSGTVVVSGKDGEATIKLDDLDAIEFPTERASLDPGDVAKAQPAIRVMTHDGRILTGVLASVTDGTVRLACRGITGQVDIPVVDISGVVSLSASPPSPREERAGVLVVGDARVPGCLVDGAPWGGGLAWLPTGSLTASGFAGEPEKLSAAIEYVASAAREKISLVDGAAEIGGLGAQISDDENGGFVIAMMVEDGAAARDGRITPGDRILAVRPRPRGRLVETRGLDLGTVMNLLRGHVGTPVEVKVQSPDGGEPRLIDLVRQQISIGGEQVLKEALETHDRLGGPGGGPLEGTKGYPAIVALVSGDLVPAVVERIDEKGVWIRSPVTAHADHEAVAVANNLVKAIELDPTAAPSKIQRDRFERLLTVPRSQKDDPPTHLLRLRSGDYLRGKLVSLDATQVTFEVVGQKKQFPRDIVVRLIWLHPAKLGDDKVKDPNRDDGVAQPQGRAGLLVQSLAVGGQRATIEAERVEGSVIIGRSPAFGPARIDTQQIDKLLIGRAMTDTKEDLPFAKWRLRVAPLPRALRETE